MNIGIIMYHEPSLNRTSVGLKPITAARQAGTMTCLNRTSVGLKLGLAPLDGHHCDEPQSNQRGIETIRWLSSQLRIPLASIEPAWD